MLDRLAISGGILKLLMAKHPYAEGLQIIFIPSTVPPNFYFCFTFDEPRWYSCADYKARKLLSQDVVQTLMLEKEQKNSEFYVHHRLPNTTI